ncbi:Uncharacterised protein [Vibrio cholerae]|nr:Uncharacterised protein [Vibrio cholerae]CSI87023.1 Uncharacterised protein [Vibrio cholerae]
MSKVCYSFDSESMSMPWKKVKRFGFLSTACVASHFFRTHTSLGSIFHCV